MIKKILLYVLCLLPWFITSILPLNYNYYKEIIKPSLAPPPIFYGIACTIIYILVTYTIYSVLNNYKYSEPYYSKGITNIYISSGLGTKVHDYRMFNKPSFNFYRLKAQS